MQCFRIGAAKFELDKRAMALDGFTADGENAYHDFRDSPHFMRAARSTDEGIKLVSDERNIGHTTDQTALTRLPESALVWLDGKLSITIMRKPWRLILEMRVLN